MHPFLVNRQIGPLHLRIATYGVFTFLSILVAGALFIFLAQEGRKKLLAHLIFYGIMLISLGIGSRVIQFLLDIVMGRNEGVGLWTLFTQSGSTIMGGVIFALPALFIFGKIDPHRVVNRQSIDALYTALPLGHMFGRIGCYFGGCCYGDICTTWKWTITYPDNWVINLMRHDHIPQGPRYPSPFLEAGGLLLIGIILLIILKTVKHRGQIIALYYIFYGAVRFTVEFTRGDTENRGYIGSLSTFQYLSIFLFILGIALLIRFFILKKRGLTTSPFLPVSGKEPREEDAFGF